MPDITVTAPEFGSVPISYTDRGQGPAVLILHGGAGSISVGGFADQLAETLPARVIAPVHPGFDSSPRPEALCTVTGLAMSYSRLLDGLELTDVTVIGNSIGGWIAAELALQSNPRVGRLVLANAVGLHLPEHPIVDVSALSIDEVVDRSYYQPNAFRFDPTSLPEAQQAVLARNQASLALYGGTEMADSTLLGRLPDIAVPALIVWGAADRIVPIEHGHAYADAIPRGELTVIEHAGHLPQLESPDAFLALIHDYVR